MGARAFSAAVGGLAGKRDICATGKGKCPRGLGLPPCRRVCTIKRLTAAPLRHCRRGGAAEKFWGRMMSSCADGLSMRDIVGKLRALAAENGLDFGIVAWRYRHESETYNLVGARPAPIV